ncbi:MAG: hypothetical protein KDA79_23450 [Planctomycetaceae bacterium]|nr:hypothetical protein [Planctomycetaceae bacterium]
MLRVAFGGCYNHTTLGDQQFSSREQLKHESVRRFLEILDGVSREGSSRKVCPDCGGSGRYVGLTVIDSCSRCGGRGELD